MATSHGGSQLILYFDERAIGRPASLRDERGRFALGGAQGAMERRNRRLAETLQAQVVANITRGIRRKQVSTNRLIKATADRKNIFATPFGMGVGVENYLDKSQAMYWRTIEQGSAGLWKRPFTSLELVGIWGANLGRWRSAPSGGRWVEGAAPYAKTMNVNGGEKFQPFRIGRGGGPSGLPVIRPTHDIRPMHAYRAAAERVKFRDQSIQTVREYLRRVLDLPTLGGGASAAPGLSPKFTSAPPAHAENQSYLNGLRW